MSFCVLLLVAVGACSSDPTTKGGDGGNGTTIPGGGTATNSGGSASSSGSGSVISPIGGSSTGTSGASSTAGTANAGGTSSAAQQCVDTPFSCVDAETITGCDPDTLMSRTEKCADLIESLGPGLKSEGCTVVEGRSVCNYDFEDTACRDGAPVFTFCYNDARMEDVDPLDFYFACFDKEMFVLKADGQPDVMVDAHDLIPCFSAYVMGNVVDCDAASEACFPALPETGAGGAGP